MRFSQKCVAGFLLAVMAMALAQPGYAFADIASSATQTSENTNKEAAFTARFAALDKVSFEAETTDDGAEEDSPLSVSEESSVEISADARTAQLEGAIFALDEFIRARVGSNRLINDEYHGYVYLAASTDQNLSVVALSGLVVVYIPQTAAGYAGLSIDSEEDLGILRAMIEALDDEANRGGATATADSRWLFTSEKEFEVDGISFRFDQELIADQFFTSIIGTDGSDITDENNPLNTTIYYANFAKIVKKADLNFVAPTEGFDAFVEFRENLDYRPLWVTLRTTGTAIVFIFILGLAAAYFSLRIPTRAQDIADSIFTIPMVLPPTVCGFLLLLAFGKSTPLGQWFIDVGFPLVFSWPATVIAAVIVAFPLMYRSARGAFEGLDPNMLDAARTLGWSNRKIFFRLMLPLSWSSIAAGTVLAFARALGEFGATMFLAGNFTGVTRTIPIAIYFEWMNGNVEVALFWTIVIIIISFVVILFINMWSKRTTKYKRRSNT